MLLSKILLETKIENSIENREDISEIYFIIYRIYCIPEKKSYIGQTCSHMKSGEFFIPAGIGARCKRHYSDREKLEYKDRPLYKALNTYSTDQFEVTEEQHVFGKDLARINQIEAEYIIKYESQIPKGYNFELVGKRYSELLKQLAEYHGFTIDHFEYKDPGRNTRKHEVGFGTRFNLARGEYDRDIILQHIENIKVEGVELRRVSPRGKDEYRVIVTEVDQKNTIRIYAKDEKDACELGENIIALHQDKNINIVISPNFYKGYKYQPKLDKILGLAEYVVRVRGFANTKQTTGVTTYTVHFRGIIDGKKQLLMTISFGGKKIPIETSMEEALKFVEKFKNDNDKSTPVYEMEPI